jgi:hypothetical protein
MSTITKQQRETKLLERRLRDRNQAFQGATVAQKRVLIAKDVLKLISEDKVDIKKGNFIVVPLISEEVGECQANKAVEEGKVKCTVCAKGSLFLGHVYRTNNIIVDDLDTGNGSNEIANRLKNVFTEKQLDLIETAFEGEYYNWNGKSLLNEKEEQKALEFFENSHFNPTERLKAILKNIISNSGTFKP